MWNAIIIICNKFNYLSYSIIHDEHKPFNGVIQIHRNFGYKCYAIIINLLILLFIKINTWLYLKLSPILFYYYATSNLSLCILSVAFWIHGSEDSTSFPRSVLCMSCLASRGIMAVPCITQRQVWPYLLS